MKFWDRPIKVRHQKFVSIFFDKWFPKKNALKLQYSLPKNCINSQNYTLNYQLA